MGSHSEYLTRERRKAMSIKELQKQIKEMWGKLTEIKIDDPYREMKRREAARMDNCPYGH
jgi:hypothetical protein